jgi:hypothetical protein
VFAVEISEGLIFGLIPISFTMVVGLMAWMVRELGRISETSARLEERIHDHERRLDRLEG